MTPKQLKEFRALVLIFIEKMKAKGKKFTTYTCPHCQKILETVQPKKKEVSSKGFWDTCKGCYECGKTAFVKTWPNGKTEVINLS